MILFRFIKCVMTKSTSKKYKKPSIKLMYFLSLLRERSEKLPKKEHENRKGKNIQNKNSAKGPERRLWKI